MSVLGLGSCTPRLSVADPESAVDREDPGEEVLSIAWRKHLRPGSRDTSPQEFSSAAIDVSGLYVGTRDGWFYAFTEDGRERWKVKTGPVSARPALDRGRLYIGTDDGVLICLTTSGEEKWRFLSDGPILETATLTKDLVIFANESDRVTALKRKYGKVKWRFKEETPDDNIHRGHAGVALFGDRLYTGFSNGTVAALRLETGTAVWSSSLSSGKDAFTDVDVTPLIYKGQLYAASSAGGLFALDAESGAVTWQADIDNIGGLNIDSDRLYAASAGQGVFALDHMGRILWNQGLADEGEPSMPQIDSHYLLVPYSKGGLIVAEKRTGRVLQYFDPGYGVSAAPLWDGHRLYVLSNSAIFYAMNLH